MLTFSPVNLNWIPEFKGRIWSPVCQTEITPPYGNFRGTSQKMENYVTDIVRGFWAAGINFLPSKYLNSDFVNSLILQWGYRLIHNSIDAGLSTDRRGKVHKSLSFAIPNESTFYAIDVFDLNGGFNKEVLGFDFYGEQSYPSEKLGLEVIQEGGAGEGLLLIHKAVSLVGGEVLMGNFPVLGNPIGAYVRIVLPETALHKIVFEPSFIPQQFCD